ncbi:MAG: hypothetical protein AAF078_07405 [Planctomycetota bacterium]
MALPAKPPRFVERPLSVAATRWLNTAAYGVWVVGTVCVVAVNVKTIIASGPIICVFALAAMACAVRAGFAIFAGVTAALCVLLFLRIYLGGLTPHAAELPVGVIGFLYAVGGLPMTVLVWRWKSERLDPRVCASCGYPLQHLTDPRCPECGAAFDPERVAEALAAWGPIADGR